MEVGPAARCDGPGGHSGVLAVLEPDECVVQGLHRGRAPPSSVLSAAQEQQRQGRATLITGPLAQLKVELESALSGGQVVALKEAAPEFLDGRLQPEVVAIGGAFQGPLQLGLGLGFLVEVEQRA